ncbi:uncharacterized protein LOC122023358 [Zingiber officinale]|uniref:Uncharacterized protein n=1 Tax=Zingiber officinale TaxID=94328 RepID=A0A8J5C8Q6_ZINOF|nr:uncharacterized protein LOC122023358 [Zingiber officinale]KAG6474850.1 hypothetical protein ZIOFF_064065 [Zingiber officinale]
MEPKLVNSRAERRNGLVECFCLARRSSGRRRRFAAEEEGRQAAGTVAVGRVISAEKADDGVVRVRIVVSKRELKLMVAAAASVSFDENRRRGSRKPLQSAEQLLQGLRRLHAQSAAGRIGRWSPALRSIPEEN